jgi:hypothetical protein
MQMKYDFIEIGTSDFDTLCQICDEDTVGISIEAVKPYLDRLPKKKNVTLVNSAFVTEEYFKTNQTIEVYYTHPEIIDKHNLSVELRGSNSVGSPHEYQIKYYDNYQDHAMCYSQPELLAFSRDLVKEGLVSVDTVDCITWEKLFDMYNITSVDFIKIDAEGMDNSLVLDLINFCVNSNQEFPKKIQFEKNYSSASKKQNDELLQTLTKHGYDVKTVNHDVIATM